MVKTRLFKNDGAQAVLIPDELAYSNWDLDLVIEREGDELRIRPAARRWAMCWARWRVSLPTS